MNPGIHRRRAAGHLILNLAYQRNRIRGIESLPASHHLVEDRAQGKQVRTQVDGFAPNLFGRAVGHEPAQAFSRFRCDKAHVGDAIAQDLHHPVPLHHDLGRLQRTMGHALRGSLLQTGANLPRNVEQIPDGEAFLARQHGSHAVALDVLHGRAELAVNLTGAVEQDNVLANELARALAFGDQRLDKRFRAVAQRLQTLRLERHDLVRLRVHRLVNQGGVGLRKLTLNLETAKHRRHYNRLAVTSRTAP